MYICVILEILAQISVSSLKGLYATSGALWCYLMHWRSTQVFSFCKDNCCSDKKLYYWVTMAIQHQRRSCGIWGRGAVVAAGGGMWLWNYNAEYGGGGDQWRRTSWGICGRWKSWEKGAEPGWSLVRYCDCSCYENCLYFLPHFIYPLCVVDSPENRVRRWCVTPGLGDIW